MDIQPDTVNQDTVSGIDKIYYSIETLIEDMIEGPDNAGKN